jgi:type I restriction enzyme S subunit
MKKGWETKRIEELCDVEYGTRVVNKRDGGTIYPVYGGGGATFFMDKFNREDCFIVSRFAMSEQCTRFVNGKFFLNDSGLSVKPKNTKEISQEFLNLELLHLNDKIYSLARGTAQKNLDVPAFRNTLITFPISLREQQRIVSILDKCFEAIDRAKLNAERNLKNTKELYESYVDRMFDNKGEGWEEKTLEEICEFRNGAAHEQFIDEDGTFILVNSKFISSDGNKGKRTNSALSPLFKDEIAFVMSDVPNGKALAKCFLVKEDGTFTLNQRIGAIKSKLLIPEFLLYQFNRNKYLLSFNNGENQTNLRKGDILKCPLWLTSKKEQQMVVNQLTSIRAQTHKLELAYEQKISDLDELKKSILQKAFSGELNTEITL